MGIQQSNGHNCTGVLIEVDSNELARFDERERGYDRIEVDLKHIFPHDEDADDHLVIRKAHQKRKVVKDSAQDGHDEIIIKSNDHHDNSRVRIRDIGVNTSTRTKVWVYMPQNGGDGANHNYPIMQSYLDIILRGRLSIGKEFAESFLESTHGFWHDYTIHNPQLEAPAFLWVDDRNNPYYVRADEKWSEEMEYIRICSMILLKRCFPNLLKKGGIWMNSLVRLLL